MVEAHVTRAVEADNRWAIMSFRAIFAGWLLATGMAVLLYIGGLAMGFSIFNPWNAAASAKGIGIGTSIWVVLTWVVSLWLGGMFASWFAAHDDRTVGTLHGVTVWGLSVTAVLLWIVMGLGMHGTNAPMAAALSSPSGTPGSVLISPKSDQQKRWLGNGSLAVLQAEVLSRLNSHDRETADRIVEALLEGRDDVASNLFAASNGTSTAESAGIMASMASDTQAAQIDTKIRADRIAHDMATALWVIFASVLLGLIAAMLGGWVGAHHICRIYHLRTFETSRPGTFWKMRSKA
ncbi:hypothetical protein [Dyella acidiphila]|uniref:Uncharacterized protein n=1 Tax=Dyella acidiphila TaxID=2775866 RepID=A0ABR9GBX9_9GAMM|nr:hypothetical protein [Dyella acidiphila]MBE1161561.1 hypothetical protein [Dyella acidiphila]